MSEQKKVPGSGSTRPVYRPMMQNPEASSVERDDDSRGNEGPLIPESSPASVREAGAYFGELIEEEE